MKSLRILFVFAVILVTSVSGRAATIYEITFDQLSYPALPGDTVEVAILMREIRDVGDLTPARLAPGGDDGLFAAGFIFDFGGGDAAASIDSFQLNDAADRFEPTFTTETDGQPNPTYQVDTQSRNVLSGIEVNFYADGGREVYEIEMGRFVVRNDGSASSITNLALAETPLTKMVFADIFEPTAITYGTATFGGPVAIPEPSAVAVMGAAGLLAGWRRYRRVPKRNRSA